jgi:cell wall assembly regulator SMI1
MLAPMSNVEAIWKRVTTCLGEHAGTMKLRPPASEATIAAVERELGVALPADYRAWLQLHDGEDDVEGRVEWLPAWGRLLPIDVTLERWRDEQEWAQRDDDEGFTLYADDDRIRCVVKHARRIVIAGNRYGDGDNTYLDLVPGPQGTSGQVIVGVTECDFEVVGASFTDFLQRWATVFEAGQLAVSDRDGQLRVDLVDKPNPWDRWESVLREVTPR